MKKSWLFRGAGVIGLTAMAILLMISPVLANTTTTTTPPTPPTVTTNAATYTQMSSTGNPEITFNGTLTIGSYKSVSVYFEYGLTTAYGYTSAKITKKTSGTFSATAITNLAVGTTYDYRADVKYGSTVIHGSNQTAVITSSLNNPSDYPDGIYFDQTNGDTLANGADGTPSKPLNNEADTLTQLTTKKLSKIYIVSSTQINTFTIPNELDGITFIGVDYDVCGVNLNEYVLNLCSFFNCAIVGGLAGGIESFNHCLIMMDSDPQGSRYNDCYINYLGGSSAIVPQVLFINCTFYNAAVFGGQIDIVDGTGWVTLHCLSANTDITGHALVVTLGADCLSGNAIVYGDVSVTDDRVASLTGVAGGSSLATGVNTVASATVMTDPTFSATPSILVGLTIKNTTDGSSGIIIANTATTVTVTALAGGVNNTWGIGDAFSIERGILVDGTANFIPNSLVGLTATNLTDGSSGIISGNTTVIVTVFLSGGTKNTWTNGDAYSIALNNQLTDHSLEALIK